MKNFRFLIKQSKKLCFKKISKILVSYGFKLEICSNKLSYLSGIFKLEENSIESEEISRMKVLDVKSEAKYLSNIQNI